MPTFGIVYSGTTHNSSGPYKTLAAAIESTLSYNTDNRQYFGMQPQVPLPPQTYRTVFTSVSMALIITLHLNKSMELIKCQLYSISGSTHTQTVSVSGSVIGNSGRLNGGHIDYAHSHNYTTCGAGNCIASGPGCK